MLWNNFKHNIKWKFRRAIGNALSYDTSHQNKTPLRADYFLNKIHCLVKEGIMETQATIILESNMSRRQTAFPEQLKENLKKAIKICVCLRQEWDVWVTSVEKLRFYKTKFREEQKITLFEKWQIHKLSCLRRHKKQTI